MDTPLGLFLVAHKAFGRAVRCLDGALGGPYSHAIDGPQPHTRVVLSACALLCAGMLTCDEQSTTFPSAVLRNGDSSVTS
jgi:hypothetical protein